MTSIEQSIRRSLADGSWQTTRHAAERLRERRIVAWQVATGSEAGTTIDVEPDAEPNPKVSIRVTLANGSEVIAIWAWLATFDRAALITVYPSGELS